MYHRFPPASIAGAVCWSAPHIGIGSAAGASAKDIESVFTGAMWVLLGVAAVFDPIALSYQAMIDVAALPAASRTGSSPTAAVPAHPAAGAVRDSDRRERPP
ncbi:hypothetical protein [Saccharothrix sp. Mg75]|uniref:hypothetical protein n=1 Tax=Saccharothrix sp. Mg75 TaxID=3445357 RepID=UPI003EF02ABA